MASISVTNLDAFRVWISNELVMLPTFSADPHAVSDLLAEQFTKEISPSDAQTACIAHLNPLLGKGMLPCYEINEFSTVLTMYDVFMQTQVLLHRE